MTTTDGIWIGCREVARGDMTGPWSARVVLSDSTVDAAVLETARGGIVRSGLGYDWSDVAVLTNIQADHFGQDGIHTVEDVLRIKSLVAERVREGGTLVLNADDELLCGLPANPRVAKVSRNVVYFSLSLNNIVVQRHIAKGGTAYALKGDWIEEHRGTVSRRVARVSDMPCTFHGTADFQIANVLACIAACRACGLEPEAVASALMGFDNSRQNDGRVNLYEYRDSVVVLDYAHNPHAVEAISRMVERWGAIRKTAVIGLPGDRTDDLLRESARCAARHFDSIVIREDKDLRGRQLGEMPRLIEAAIRETAPHVEVAVIPDELEAMAYGASRLSPGEAMVCFCEHQHEAAEWMNNAGANLCDDPSCIRDVVARGFGVPA
jgi:cyanophycin synthetase